MWSSTRSTPGMPWTIRRASSRCIWSATAPVNSAVPFWIADVDLVALQVAALPQVVGDGFGHLLVGGDGPGCGLTAVPAATPEPGGLLPHEGANEPQPQGGTQAGNGHEQTRHILLDGLAR